MKAKNTLSGGVGRENITRVSHDDVGSQIDFIFTNMRTGNTTILREVGCTSTDHDAVRSNIQLSSAWQYKRLMPKPNWLAMRKSSGVSIDYT